MNSHKSLIAFGIVAAGAVIIGFGYLQFTKDVRTNTAVNDSIDDFNKALNVAAEYGLPLAGTLLLTVEDTETKKPEAYTFSFAEKKFSRLDHPLVESHAVMYPALVEDGAYLFYASPYVPGGTGAALPYNKPPQVMLASGTEVTSILARPFRWRSPAVVSPNNQAYAFFAYKGRPSEVPSEGFDVNISNWGIYVGSFDGKAKIVGTGVSPAWGPDGRLYFIGEKGIYRHHFVAENNKVLYPLGVSLSPRSMAISPDGQYLALGATLSGTIQIFKIIDLDNFRLELLTTYEVENERFYEISFSPDSQYVVYVVEHTQLGNGKDTSFVEVMRVEDQKTQRLFELDNEILKLAPKWITK